MRKRSIKQWVTLCFTVFLLLSMIASAGWNYFWTTHAALEAAENQAGTCSRIIGMLLEEWKLKDLSADQDSDLTGLMPAARGLALYAHCADFIISVTRP